MDIYTLLLSGEGGCYGCGRMYDTLSNYPIVFRCLTWKYHGALYNRTVEMHVVNHKNDRMMAHIKI